MYRRLDWTRLDPVVDALRSGGDGSGRAGYGEIQAIAHLLGISSRTVRRRLTGSGPRGRRRQFELSPDELGFYFAQGCSPSDLIRHIDMTRARAPSKRTIERAIARIPTAQRIYATHGNAELRFGQGVSLIQDRAPYRNDRWLGDHAHCRIRIIWPGRTPYLTTPWITPFIDDATSAILGYELSPSRESVREGRLVMDKPDSTTIAMALLYSVGEHPQGLDPFYGYPQELVTDNGAEWKSEHLKELAAANHINLPVMRPFQPNERGRMERFFRTFKQSLRSFHGALDGPKDPNGEPKGWTPDNALHLEEFVAKVEEFLYHYHRRPQRGLGCSPLHAWNTKGRPS